MVRAKTDKTGARPATIDIRLKRDDTVLSTATIGPKQSVDLPDGGRLTLGGIPYWMRLFGTRDFSLPLIYAGFCLILAGSVIIFGVVKVDTLVSVVPDGDVERVVVALKARRFAPLYEDRFADLVRAQGGVG